MTPSGQPQPDEPDRQHNQWPDGFDPAIDAVCYAPHEALTIQLKLDPDICAQLSQQTADGDIKRHILSLIMNDLENPIPER